MKAHTTDDFWLRIQGASHEDCWLWTSATDRYGYGKFRFQRRWHQAHKFAYELMVHVVPAGLELDHLCRTRACVNPWHLEPVTHRVNTARRAAFVSHDPGPAFCVHGHLRNTANVYVSPGGVMTCRPCNRASQARSKARKKAAA